MASVITALVTYLASQSTITAVLDSGAAMRYYPRLPANPKYPAVAYQVISDLPSYSHQGDSKTTKMRLQLTLWGKTYGAVDDLAQRLRTVLSGLKQKTIGGILIEGIQFSNTIDDYQETTQTHQRFIDLLIMYQAL